MNSSYAWHKWQDLPAKAQPEPPLLVVTPWDSQRLQHVSTPPSLEAAVARGGEVGNISYIPVSSIRWDYWLTPAAQLNTASSQLAVRLSHPTWGTVSLHGRFCSSCSCCSFISKLHPWFLARAESKAPFSPVLQTQGIQVKIGSSKFSDFFQNFEHPSRQLPLRKATGVNLRCDSESQVPILVQCKASVLNSAHVTSLTAAKTNCVCKMNRGHVTYVNWASQFVASVTLL